MTRRTFLAASLAAAAPGRELRADVVILGGGLGGVAAALAVARSGRTALLTEETDWIGGQLTSQAVPPDEHRWIEDFGATRTYREYRNRVRRYYRRNYPLTAEARARWNLNPGAGAVSRLCHEPRVSLAVLEEMLAPHVSAGRVRVLLEHQVVAADAARDLVRSVEVRHLPSGARKTLHAPYFLDATEMGDLLPLAGVEYVLGFESQKQTGESRAPAEPQPRNLQAFTCCFAVDYLPGEDHTIDRPAEYGFWRDYVPQLRPPWPGKLLSWTTTHPVTLQPRVHAFDPEGEAKGVDAGLWLYRRIAARRNFAPGAYPSDICLINWPQNDYWLGPLCDAPGEEAARHLRRAKQLSLSLLYWMQTEAGWKGLRLRPDVVGTEDGLAKYPYIRESRRIRAEFTVLEQHVSRDTRFPDSVGLGSYRIDLHPSTGGDNYIDLDSRPFQIPLGALLPLRVHNVLPACKNLGTTHITNGCYRLHPVEWNIGESAGALASFCLAAGLRPREVRAKRLADFQNLLAAAGVELDWPRL